MKVLVTLFLMSASLFARERLVSPFEMRWMNNADTATLYRSSDHPNAVFVVETYFNTCPACNQNAPIVERLAETYADRPEVQFLDVSRDCRDADYRSWIAKHNPKHPVLNDCALKLQRELGTSRYPTTYVLDCKMNVLYSNVGVWSSSVVNQIKAVVDRQVAQGCSVE